MKIEKITSVKNRLGTNSYLIFNEEKNAILIDAGVDLDTVKNYNLNIKAIFLTHCHFDHIMFLNQLEEFYSCAIYISEIDYKGMFDKEINLSKFFHRDFSINFDKSLIMTFKDGEIIHIDSFKIITILTPGHTSGSACFLVDNNLFSGDTLFADNIGRTDFPTSSVEQQKSSLLKLDSLNYKILYPGHSEISTKEKQKYNINFWFNLLN